MGNEETLLIFTWFMVNMGNFAQFVTTFSKKPKLAGEQQLFAAFVRLKLIQTSILSKNMKQKYTKT